MKKVTALFAITLLITISPAVMAVSQQSQNSASGSNSSQSNQSSSSSTSNQVQSQTQTQTSNQGEESQLQISQEIKTKISEAKSTYSSNNTATQQALTSVSNAAGSLIQLSSKVQTQNAGLATQIQNIAKEQVQSFESVSQSIDNASTRNGVLKFFIGANYKQINEADKQMEQNRLRIQELNKIKAQIQNTGTATELQNQINVLEALNTSLQDQINQLNSGFSLLGWLFNWIS